MLVLAVANYGSDQYLKHNKNLLLAERGTELLRQVEQLDEEE